MGDSLEWPTHSDRTSRVRTSVLRASRDPMPLDLIAFIFDRIDLENGAANKDKSNAETYCEVSRKVAALKMASPREIRARSDIIATSRWR